MPRRYSEPPPSLAEPLLSANSQARLVDDSRQRVNELRPKETGIGLVPRATPDESTRSFTSRTIEEISVGLVRQATLNEAARSIRGSRSGDTAGILRSQSTLDESAISVAGRRGGWRASVARCTRRLARRPIRERSGEWYGHKEFSVTYFAAYAFYYTYTSYILLVMISGMFLLKFTNPAFTYMEALFMSISCVSQAGLSIVDWANAPISTHIASIFLIILGSASLLSAMPVCFRMNSFRRQRALLNKMSQDTISQHNPTFWGAHWESFMRNYGLEYEALRKMLKILLGYWVGVQLLGWVSLCIYLRFFRQDFMDKFETAETQHTVWDALYLAVSAFQNNGLTLNPSSVESFAEEAFPMTVIMLLILLGNTALPICIRGVATLARVSTHRDSDSRRAYDFLLTYPRRCYTLMFPMQNTIWLCIMVVGLTSGLTAVILIEDANSIALARFTTGQAFINALFQAVSSRTAGFNSIDLNHLSMGSTFVMVIWMYIAASPTVVIMRHSAHVTSPLRNRSDADLSRLQEGMSGIDITGKCEGRDEETEPSDTIKYQARRYFLQHSVVLVVIVFLILCIEKDRLESARKRPDNDDVYGDVGFFKIIFDVVSAYGTSGLSLGYKDKAYSFVGALRPGSQLLVCLTMFLGRIRGLPDSIDSSVIPYRRPDFIAQDDIL
eukprot:GEMP01026217.1.p1 GENE.GEMP01026217.1~~GEMP01026217.1.p1  ORF type:complete len:670 (-),score=78.93 GEMP01026217.1:191-2200(-)